MKRNRHLHPSNNKLGRWLDGDEPALDVHVSQCLRCAGRLEKIVDGDVATLRSALLAVTAPQPGQQLRIREGINRKMDARGDLSLIGDLIGIPYQTAKVISGGKQPNG